MRQILDPDILDHIIAIEGDDYKDPMSSWRPRPGSDQSIEAFQAHYTELRDFAAQEGLPITEVNVGSSIQVNGNGAIYGAGGYHRYFVMVTGEVVFSKYHATEEGRKLAAEQGFRVA